MPTAIVKCLRDCGGVICIGVCVPFLLIGQSPPSRPEFEVAAIHMYDPHSERASTPNDGTRRGGPGTQDPRLLRFSAVPLIQIVAEAYDVSWNQVSGPDWMTGQRYDINATVADKATVSQAREMLRNLLIDRLRLSCRIRTKMVEGYELIRTRGDPTLQEPLTRAPQSTSQAPDLSARLDPDGFPILPPGVNQAVDWMPGRGFSVSFKETSISEFARWIGMQLGGQLVQYDGGKRVSPWPVIDKTGLGERYDFTFRYQGVPFSSLSPEGAARTLSALDKALETQLGLKLIKAQIPLDNVFVDHIDKVPAPN